MLRGKEGLS